jgi:hypothetical protein
MAIAFRIKNWDKYFENNRSREMKRLEWVPVPNKMDGSGYAELVDHPNGAAHLGAWLAIIEIASRNETRGTLVRDGKIQTPQALARISRLPAALFEEVFDRLVNEIGWIEKFNEISILHDGAGKPQAPAPRDARAEENRTEENRTEKPFVAQPDNLFGLQAVPVLPLELAITETAKRIFNRHPTLRKNTTLADVQKRLAKIAKLIPGTAGKIAKLKSIDQIHEDSCESEKWTKDGGEFANGLRNWFAGAMYEIPLYQSNGDSRNANVGELWPGQRNGAPAPGLVGDDC